MSPNHAPTSARNNQYSGINNITLNPIKIGQKEQPVVQKFKIIGQPFHEQRRSPVLKNKNKLAIQERVNFAKTKQMMDNY